MGLIVFILAIVGLLWAAVLAWRGSLLLGCALYLIVACCFSGYFWSIDAVGLTWSLDRFFLMFLLIAFALQWRWGKCDPKAMTRVDLLLGAFLALLVISTFTSDWRTKGPDDESVLMHLVNGYFVPVAIFLVARHARLDQDKLRSLYAILACFGVYLVLTALAESAHAWAIVFPKYISDADLGTHFGRARGPMLQSARLGLYLVACASATIAYFTWSGKWTRHGVVITALLTPLYLAATYVTYTRGVWLGMGTAGVVALVATLQGKRRAVAVLVVLTAGVFVIAAKGDSLVAFKRDTSASDTAESTYMRASFAYVSWLMFQDQPITGVGFGQFPKESTYYLSDRTTSLRLEQIRGYIHHNTYLSLLVELGIFGLLLLLGVFVLWMWQSWQLWSDASLPFGVRAHGLFFLLLMGPFFLQMLFREVSYSPIENGLIFLFAGTTSSLHATYKRAPVTNKPHVALTTPTLKTAE